MALILRGLSARGGKCPKSARYPAVVERLNQTDRACAVAAAAAHDFNDELTIIVNSASQSIRYLEPGHPARPYITEIAGAVQRCVWKVAGLLTYSARKGLRPVNVPMEQLLSDLEVTR